MGASLRTQGRGGSMTEVCGRAFSRRRRAALLAGLLLAVGPVSAAVAGEPSGGRLAKSIATTDGRASYACYLPKTYRAEKKWPALVLFAPDGNGGRFAEYF